MKTLKNVQEALRNYAPGGKESLADRYFDKHQYMMTWQINNLCNFNCPYCGKFTCDDPDVFKYSPEHIADCFNNYNRQWHIIITGGEPFIHKHILQICSLLTQNHYISVNTNLSNKKIIEFADTINPERVIAINASIHFQVRIDRNILDEYISNFMYLQDRGFNIIGSYVVYPTETHQFKNDIEMLRSRGLRQISSKVFHGKYNGQKYPEAYTPEEFSDITSEMNSEIEMMEYIKYTRFKGLMCGTGRRMLSLKPNGDIERCLTEYTPLGNFFDGTFKMPRYDKACESEVCNCPYQGMLFSYKKKSFLGLF